MIKIQVESIDAHHEDTVREIRIAFQTFIISVCRMKCL